MSKISQLHDIDIKTLRIFCTIVEEGGFTAAQAALNLSQSSLSEYLKALEIRLGVTLCQRGPKGFQLFEVGHEVYLAARELLASIETFRSKVGNINEGVVGQLVIGVQDGVVANPDARFHEALRQFETLYPGIRIKMEVMLGFQLSGRVADGLIGLGIGLRNDAFPQVAFEKLFTEVDQLYCGIGHPIFDIAGESLEEQDLRAYRYCSRGHLEFVHPDWTHVNEATSDIGLGVDAQLALVLSGRNLGYLPEHVAEPYVTRGLLRPVVSTRSRHLSQIGVLIGPGAKKYKIARKFVDVLMAVHAP